MFKERYYYGDPYFGHSNVIRMCNRPFENVEAMNETLIERWNSRVTGQDDVYIIGDMFFRCEDPETILRQLKGHKHLLVGNHDTSWMERVPLSRYFVDVEELSVVTDGKRTIAMCHYPLLTWKHQHRANSYMIHGHLHNNTDQDFWPSICARERLLNAGVDINSFMPVTIEELIVNNEAFKKMHWREYPTIGSEESEDTIN